MAARAEDPDELTGRYARLINDAIAARPPGMLVGMHLCRGNLKGAWMAEGGYEPIAEILFNTIDANVYCLEYDTARAGDFSPLRHLPGGKRVILGLVSTKTPVLEKKESLKRQIDAASRYAGLEQLVENFQRSRRLAVDGIAGLQTQLVLDSALGAPGTPTLAQAAPQAGA